MKIAHRAIEIDWFWFISIYYFFLKREEKKIEFLFVKLLR